MSANYKMPTLKSTLGWMSMLPVTILLFKATIATAQTQETPKEVIAAQIHKQGYPCKKPNSAERDAAASKPNETVWVLQCENAKYRVRLVPDMAAHVTKLE